MLSNIEAIRLEYRRDIICRLLPLITIGRTDVFLLVLWMLQHKVTSNGAIYQHEKCLLCVAGGKRKTRNDKYIRIGRTVSEITIGKTVITQH